MPVPLAVGNYGGDGGGWGGWGGQDHTSRCRTDTLSSSFKFNLWSYEMFMIMIISHSHLVVFFLSCFAPVFFFWFCRFCSWGSAVCLLVRLELTKAMHCKFLCVNEWWFGSWYVDCIHIRSYLVLQISLEEIPYIIYKTECGILSKRNWTGVALWLES